MKLYDLKDLVFRRNSRFTLEIAEFSLGQREKAVEHYTRFTNLWRDCDPEFRPLVEDAQERLRLLR